MSASPAPCRPPLPKDRLVALPGTRNFRDVGGYATADGTMQTRWHLLYRADQLSRLAADQGACGLLRDRLGVTTAVDLRTASERAQQPYAIAGVTVYRIPMMAGGDLLQAVQDIPELTEELVEGLMGNVYEQFVVASKPELARFFRLLVDRSRSPSADEAVVFHCKAGKDRTGICTALLLTILGVPMETVYADFLLTNRFYEVPPLRAVKTVIKNQIETGAVSALFQARRSYLERAFCAIERDYKDVPTYVREALELSDDDIAALKHRYLEAV